VTDERLVRFARELEARDERLAAAIAEVDDLQRVAEEVRERARAVEAFLDRLPAEQAAAEGVLREAESKSRTRGRERGEAESELTRAEGSGDEERVAAARRAVVRARDAETSAARKLERALEALDRLAREAEALRAEAPALEERAHELARRLARLPRISQAGTAAPEPGLEGTIEWAARARAALFVVRSGLEVERERVVREANELAASALGEPVAATSVSLVRKRIERS
jgi:chromosome segregation ATPase